MTITRLIETKRNLVAIYIKWNRVGVSWYLAIKRRQSFLKKPLDKVIVFGCAIILSVYLATSGISAYSQVQPAFAIYSIGVVTTVSAFFVLYLNKYLKNIRKVSSWAFPSYTRGRQTVFEIWFYNGNSCCALANIFRRFCETHSSSYHFALHDSEERNSWWSQYFYNAYNETRGWLTSQTDTNGLRTLLIWQYGRDKLTNKILVRLTKLIQLVSWPLGLSPL